MKIHVSLRVPTAIPIIFSLDELFLLQIYLISQSIMAVNSPFVLMLIVLVTLRDFSITFVNQILYHYECFVIIKIFDFQHWAFSHGVISMWEKNLVSTMVLDSGMLNS